jgi:DNA-binding NtrC family response regulator
MRILLVEDEPQLRRTLQALLVEEGHDVGEAEAYHVAEAMLAAPAGWDAVVTDVRLPGPGDGVKLAAKAESMGTPALLITGHPEEILALSARGIRHLMKPFPLQALLDWLTQVSSSLRPA